FARAVVAAVKSTACEGVFNIGSGEGYSLNELLTMIQEITQKRVRIDRLPSRGFDVPANVLDNDLAKQYLNWEPVTSIEEGIKKTWDAINSLVHE
ncbi:MAG: NAD-dependent epimerase, partial [Verrucomicrobiota bacterium]